LKFFFIGTDIVFLLGYITSQFWNGAVVSEVLYFPNHNPKKCNTKSGVTHLDSSFAHLTIKNEGQGEIDCSGSASVSFNPGLT
jgi:hypothetical protein